MNILFTVITSICMLLTPFICAVFHTTLPAFLVANFGLICLALSAIGYSDYKYKKRIDAVSKANTILAKRKRVRDSIVTQAQLDVYLQYAKLADREYNSIVNSNK